jgi:hypothetical protein
MCGTRCTKQAASLRRPVTNPLQDRSCFEGEGLEAIEIAAPGEICEMARIFVGTLGWHCASWRRSFFPEGLPLKEPRQRY